MRNLLIILFTLFLFSCNSTKKTKETASMNPEISMQCPEDGSCTFSVIKGKSLTVLKDGIGMKYPELKDNPKTNIIKFTYHREAPNGLVDGNYTEEIYFEIPNNFYTLDLKDEALQKVKLLYGRLCYCKGSTGYFKVTDGTLHYDKNKDGTATLSLIFNNNEVPQIIKEIEGTVSFKKK